MKNLKISASDKRLLIIVLAVLLVICSYFFVFTKQMAKASEIEKTNTTNRQKVAKLEQQIEQQDEVEKQTKDAKKNVKDMIAKYPSNVTLEKAITLMQEIQDKTGVTITKTDFVMDNVLGDIATLTAKPEQNANGDAAASGSTQPESTQQTASTEAGTEKSTETAAASTDSETQKPADSNAKVGYFASINVNYEASYDSLKSLADYVNHMSDRSTITNINAANDSETGKLSGTFTLNMYYLTGTGREYAAPVLNDNNKGVSDIFGGASANASKSDSSDTN